MSTSKTHVELNEEEIRDRIQKLRKLIIDNHDILHIRSDDSFLLRFLHCCDFDVEETHKRIQNFYEILMENPEWFACAPPSKYREFIMQNMRVLLPNVDNKGKRIYICKLGNIDADKINPKQLSQVDQVFMESILDEEEVQSKGVCVIIDMEGFSWKVFKWLTPHNLSVGNKILNVYPLKDITIHVVNSSFLLNAAVKISWPFLNQRIKNMIKFHCNDVLSLHEYVNPNVLPKEYGGSVDINFDECHNYLFKMDDLIAEKLNYVKICTEKTNK